ncbi:hypothetical protein KASHIRA_02670 [Serratia phage vB_SmaM-Kashira]|nr:hypothetical protein [Acinetobacter phage ABPH49]URC22841.1 hypothetical protein KASHIRA_02670 [Serratia phage vB_SmaM-Kashira]
MKGRLFKSLKSLQIVAIFLAPMAIWIFVGQFVAGMFFSGVYAEHPSIVPFMFMAGFAVGRIAELVMCGMVEVFKRKEGIE